MENGANSYQVAIVGGGPVGLFLACCLYEMDISCIVLEKRKRPITHSRSIGIQPVSLELFEEIGLANSFVSAGIKVEEGLTFCNEKPVGNLSFRSCPPPFPFILILPQYKTEALLAQHLDGLNASILQRNAAVTGIEALGKSILLNVRQNGEERRVSAQYVAGCDGASSFIRQAAGIPFSGKQYDDTYIMGDFSDNTSFGNAAAIFLCNQGVIESFPLPEGMRRWVVKTAGYLSDVMRRDIEQRIHQRIGHDLKSTKNRMLSSFGVQKQFAETMAKQRIALAGDAAHVISPIGGQGMNLGWLDAWDLSHCLQHLFAHEDAAESILRSYSQRRLKVARKAARRAEFNMAMGRKTAFLPVRKLFLQGLLKTPLAHLMARLFTMRGLDRG
jgi:2-polyprenyl-6-methoxyphenol hydroxylase-like FAD-dependent oxidoreductase